MRFSRSYHTFIAYLYGGLDLKCLRLEIPSTPLSMEDHSFFVGQEFPDVKAFRSAIKEAAIAQHFELRIVKSDLVRYIAKCASEGCPWRIRAVKLPSGPTFVIRSLEGTHSCGKNAQNGHHQASVDWIVNIIDQRLRHDINYKPKDILHDIYEQYGITIPYKQAWRAKERGLQAIYGSSEEGYCLLPAYCEQIRKSNPGSIAEVFTTGAENSFQRMFISFGASLHGFINGCLPIIGLGGFLLKSKYLGTLLSATSFDAEGGLFPLAFGVVDVEDDESWMWFISELQKALEMGSSGCIGIDQIPTDFVFISDGQNAIKDAVKRNFPKSSHAICMRFLSQRFGKEFKNSRLVDLLWKAAYATTIAGFREKMAEIEEVSPDAANWLQKCYPPPCWALVHFESTRYGHFTSNTEEFHRWVLEARELPVIQVIWQVHNKIMQEFEGRRGESDAWVTFLVPSVERRLLEAMECASKYQVVRSDEVEFEVMSSVDRSYIVNIGTHACSCRDWQLLGVPCSHAVAALFSCGKDLYAFTDRFFTVESYRSAYAGQVVPIPDKMSWETEDAIRIVGPPKFRRPPGRLEKRHRCVEDLNPEKHTVRCSQCNQTGHYRTTCKAEVVKFH